MKEYPITDSSFITEVQYDEDTETLTVLMRGGRSYTHDNVPATVVEDFLSSSSKGAYYNEYIKGRY